MTVGVEGRYFALRDFLKRLRSRAELEDDQQVRIVGTALRRRLDRLRRKERKFRPGDADTGPDDLIQATLAITAFSFGGAVTAPSDPAAAVSTGAAGESSAEATSP